MKDHRSYFEKANFQSELPNRLLVGVIGLFLVFLELGLANVPVFYAASPMLSLIFIYYMLIFHDNLLPVVSIFLVGIVADLLFSDVIGGRATIFMLLSYFVRARLIRLQQYEFGQLWIDFAFICFSVVLFQFVFFSIINLAIPSLNLIFFQVGLTLILFPIGFVMIYSIHRLLQKLKLVA